MEYALFLLIDILIVCLIGKYFVCSGEDCEKLKSITILHHSLNKPTEEKEPELLVSNLSDDLDILSEQLFANPNYKNLYL